MRDNSLTNELDHVVGVVEHGLFIDLTAEVYIASEGGVQVLQGAHV
jgi:ribose 5-phosphate isomerase